MVHVSGKHGFFVTMAILLLIIESCALDSLAMDVVADSLSSPGNNSVFLGDDDPQLVGDSLPFAIKFYESISAIRPDHQGMKSTIGSLYVMYANAFVQAPAQRLGAEAYALREEVLKRAKKFYLRGRDLIQEVLEKRYPGFTVALAQNDLSPLLARMVQKDVSLLYWYSAAWFSATSLDSLDTRLGVKLPVIKTMIDRALVLEPDFNGGSIHEFLMLYYASMPPGLGFDPALSEKHYILAGKAAGGISASAMVGRAESWHLPRQEKEAFVALLDQAIQIDPKQNPNATLITVLAQKRAQYLLASLDELFW